MVADSPDVAMSSTLEPAARDIIRDIAQRAWQVEARTPSKELESIRLTRIGASEIDAHRDGISIVGFTPWLASLFGSTSEEAMLDPTSTGHGAMHDWGCVAAQTAMGFVWFVTEQNRRVDQVTAGRALMRAHLRATKLGLGWHPMSQALEEFPEMASLRREMFGALGVPLTEDRPGRTVQMLVRVGYGEAGPHASRRPLDSILRS